MFDSLARLLAITSSFGIARRYFIVNGFDGALTMLGLITGFYVSDTVETAIIVNACLGAAIALGVSGVTSAYVSEAAEKRKELSELQQAMMTDLDDSPHARATRLLPVVIALINGLAPLLFSLVIISPLWIGFDLGTDKVQPLEVSILFAMAILFLLGVFLGRISGTYWLWAGLRTLLIAIFTALIILFVSPN